MGQSSITKTANQVVETTEASSRRNIRWRRAAVRDDSSLADIDVAGIVKRNRLNHFGIRVSAAVGLIPRAGRLAASLTESDHHEFYTGGSEAQQHGKESA